MTTNRSTLGDADSAVSSSEFADQRTRLLLVCGAVAGPLFIVMSVAQALTRPGFDPVKHPASLLSVGDLGWIQIATFIVTGLLFLASAVGMRRALHPGRGTTWGPRLIGAFGVALIGGGIFVADPGLGFPPGTPEGIPDEFTWHGIVHSIAPVVGFLALTLACFVFARRSISLGQRGWAAYSIFTGVVIQVLGAIPNMNYNFAPLWMAMVLGFGWASAQAARLITR
jgi:hypothetical protein